MKGAVLIIGSLLWENEHNSLKKNQGKLRAQWRLNLYLDKKIAVKVPIRYGRKSTSRRCTYTMIFSNSVSKLGTAFIVPFIEQTESFDELKNQALKLSEVEGISTECSPNRIKAHWGAVGIAFNKFKENQFDEIKKKWHEEFNSFDNKMYRIGKEAPSIQQNGGLNFEFKIPEYIDYVFATPTIPNISEYPTSGRIIDAILESNPTYETYVKNNFEHGIRVQNDEEIIKRLD